MTLYCLMLHYMDTEVYILGLLVLWISGSFAFPLILGKCQKEIPINCSTWGSKTEHSNCWLGKQLLVKLQPYDEPPLKDGNELLCGNTISELKHEEGQDNEKGVSAEEKIYENDIGQSENIQIRRNVEILAPVESLLRIKDHGNEIEQSILVTGQDIDSLIMFDPSRLDDHSPLEEEMGNKIKKVKRSSMFDSLKEGEANEEGRETENYSGENAQNNTRLGMVPKPWYWSWLFRSDSSEQTNPGSINETKNNEITTEASKNKGTENSDLMTSDSAEEAIDNLEMESDRTEQEENRPGGGRQFDMEASNNFTQQIQNAEAILQQAILAHHPGVTTTEAVWNTDEFISKTSK